MGQFHYLITLDWNTFYSLPHTIVTTNVPLNLLQEGNVLLAFSYAGRPLLREHGGPVRLVLPQLYFWKSVKWIKGMHFHCNDKPGFWEQRGYHNDANPWREERFRGQPAS